MKQKKDNVNRGLKTVEFLMMKENALNVTIAFI